MFDCGKSDDDRDGGSGDSGSVGSDDSGDDGSCGGTDGSGARVGVGVGGEMMVIVRLLLFITRKYTIINTNLKLINAKIHSFYSIHIHLA